MLHSRESTGCMHWGYWAGERSCLLYMYVRVRQCGCITFSAAEGSRLDNAFLAETDSWCSLRKENISGISVFSDVTTAGNSAIIRRDSGYQ